ILKADHHAPRVTMQVFGKARAYLGGMDEAIAILKLCADDWSALDVRALYDGDAIAPWETVMTIEGPYDGFAHLETLYLGVLARRTRVGTNTRRVVDAARAESEPCRTHSSQRTTATPCSPRRNSRASWIPPSRSSRSSTTTTIASARRSMSRARSGRASGACGSTRRKTW